MVSSGMFRPMVSSAFLASAAIFGLSRVSMDLPNTALAMLGLVISLPSLMFSVAVKPGMSMNS